MSHNTAQIRELVRDAVTDGNGRLRSALLRPVHLAVLLRQHCDSNEPLYEIARFIRDTDTAQETTHEVALLLCSSRLTEQQRYRLEYALRVLRGLT